MAFNHRGGRSPVRRWGCGERVNSQWKKKDRKAPAHGILQLQSRHVFRGLFHGKRSTPTLAQKDEVSLQGREKQKHRRGEGGEKNILTGMARKKKNGAVLDNDQVVDEQA